MDLKIYTYEDHPIRNHLIDPDALFVLERLKHAGFEAYLVGGSVRDLLLHTQPKDFDISTSAKPNEIKKLFSSCMLIGRRFRLAHIRFGKKIIEVATFRAGENSDTLIQEDNLWGNAQEDVLRRDFTINGLFYDPEQGHIIDYVGGFKDLQHHLLRSIGDPLIRFRQDPVRMIRMEKFRARFHFNTTEENLVALDTLKHEISLASKARVLEEILRMIESGYAQPFFELLHRSSLLEILLPHFSHYYRSMETLYAQLLHILDERNHLHKEHRSVAIAFLLWPILGISLRHYIKEHGIPHLGVLQDLSQDVVNHNLLNHTLPFPKKMRISITFYLTTQYRFTPLTEKQFRPSTLAHHPEIDYALQLLYLRSLYDTSLEPIYQDITHHLSR